MIRIESEQAFRDLFRSYMTVEEAARVYGYSVRHVYRLTYDMDGVLIIQLALPRCRRRQIRMIPRDMVLSIDDTDPFCCSDDL